MPLTSEQKQAIVAQYGPNLGQDIYQVIDYQEAIEKYQKGEYSKEYIQKNFGASSLNDLQQSKAIIEQGIKEKYKLQNLSQLTKAQIVQLEAAGKAQAAASKAAVAAKKSAQLTGGYTIATGGTGVAPKPTFTPPPQKPVPEFIAASSQKGKDFFITSKGNVVQQVPVSAQVLPPTTKASSLQKQLFSEVPKDSPKKISEITKEQKKQIQDVIVQKKEEEKTFIPLFEKIEKKAKEPLEQVVKGPKEFYQKQVTFYQAVAKKNVPAGFVGLFGSAGTGTAIGFIELFGKPATTARGLKGLSKEFFTDPAKTTVTLYGEQKTAFFDNPAIYAGGFASSQLVFEGTGKIVGPFAKKSAKTIKDIVNQKPSKVVAQSYGTLSSFSNKKIDLVKITKKPYDALADFSNKKVDVTVAVKKPYAALENFSNKKISIKTPQLPKKTLSKAETKELLAKIEETKALEKQKLFEQAEKPKLENFKEGKLKSIDEIVFEQRELIDFQKKQKIFKKTKEETIATIKEKSQLYEGEALEKEFLGIFKKPQKTTQKNIFSKKLTKEESLARLKEKELLDKQAFFEKEFLEGIKEGKSFKTKKEAPLENILGETRKISKKEFFATFKEKGILEKQSILEKEFLEGIKEGKSFKTKKEPLEAILGETRKKTPTESLSTIKEKGFLENQAKLEELIKKAEKPVLDNYKTSKLKTIKEIVEEQRKGLGFEADFLKKQKVIQKTSKEKLQNLSELSQLDERSKVSQSIFETGLNVQNKRKLGIFGTTPESLLKIVEAQRSRVKSLEGTRKVKTLAEIVSQQRELSKTVETQKIDFKGIQNVLGQAKQTKKFDFFAREKVLEELAKKQGSTITKGGLIQILKPKVETKTKAVVIKKPTFPAIVQKQKKKKSFLQTELEQKPIQITQTTKKQFFVDEEFEFGAPAGLFTQKGQTSFGYSQTIQKQGVSLVSVSSPNFFLKQKISSFGKISGVGFKPVTSFREKSDLSFRLDQFPVQKQKSAQEPLEIQLEKQKPLQLFKQEQEQSQKQQEKQVLLFKPFELTKTKTKTTTTTRRRGFFEKGLFAPRKQRGFLPVLFRAGKPVRFLSTKPLTRGEAIATGARFVDRTTKASFKIVPKGYAIPFGIRGPIQILRPGKRDPSLFVERTRFRISTPGEKKELRIARLGGLFE